MKTPVKLALRTPMPWVWASLILFFGCGGVTSPEDPSRNEFLKPVLAYAQCMMDFGRDVEGEDSTPMFASALDRHSLQLDTALAAVEVEGVRPRDRAVRGGNPIHDAELFAVLFMLNDWLGEESYAHEAERALAYFLEHGQSPATGLFCWGEHLHWDFRRETCAYAVGYDFHEATAWPFWDRCYGLAPEACWQFALGEWDHQVHDHVDGDFSRHARWSTHESFAGFEFPRYAGQMIERWALAYERPENMGRERREELLIAIEVVFRQMQHNTGLTISGLLPAGQSSQGDHNQVVWLTSNLELARCLELAAPLMEPSIATEMLAFARKQDDDFLGAPHTLAKEGGGFAVTLDAGSGMPRTRSMNRPYSSAWSSGYGYGTHAGTARYCFARYTALLPEDPHVAAAYQRLLLQAADSYLTSLPDTSALLKPAEFAAVVSLMLQAHELSGEQTYLERAVFYARMGMGIFLVDGNPLPRASNRHDHYESITGGPAFMRQLLELHGILHSEQYAHLNPKL